MLITQNVFKILAITQSNISKLMELVKNVKKALSQMPLSMLLVVTKLSFHVLHSNSVMQLLQIAVSHTYLLFLFLILNHYQNQMSLKLAMKMVRTALFTHLVVFQNILTTISMRIRQLQLLMVKLNIQNMISRLPSTKMNTTSLSKRTILVLVILEIGILERIESTSLLQMSLNQLLNNKL